MAYDEPALSRHGRDAQRGNLPAGTEDPYAPTPGDAFPDGYINDDDAGIIGGYYGTQADAYWITGDFDGDGDVDDDDVAVMSGGYDPDDPIPRSVTRTWNWSLDALGNWNGYNYDEGDGQSWDLAQTRDNDAANQVTSIGATVGDTWITPEFDAAGNMVSGPVPGNETVRQHYVYDAWNQVVEVRADDDGDPGDLIAAYKYDGLGGRVARLLPNETNPANWDRTDYYFNEDWQVLEERSAAGQADPSAVAEETHIQYLPDIGGQTAPVLRWRDADSDPETGDGGMEETFYYVTDALGSVTVLVNGDTGSVAATYCYDPYGRPVYGTSLFYENEVMNAGYPRGTPRKRSESRSSAANPLLPQM